MEHCFAWERVKNGPTIAHGMTKFLEANRKGDGIAAQTDTGGMPSASRFTIELYFGRFEYPMR